MAAEHHAKLTLLHVVNPKELEHVPDHDRVLQALDDKLQDLLGSESGPCQRRVECGRVAPTIVRIALELNADMLVLGVRPASGVLSRFMWPNRLRGCARGIVPGFNGKRARAVNQPARGSIGG